MTNCQIIGGSGKKCKNEPVSKFGKINVCSVHSKIANDNIKLGGKKLSKKGGKYSKKSKKGGKKLSKKESKSK